ncbi:hypothetical protein [Sandaracinus amylolyticus]|uniref:hypothetical protein n=1 Tax=Sandaracinus amylolyticus TaxID=927083 RepID=UPI001F2FD51E|nr:hypothetical protein [Sandaracinus amylolyticus]
MSDAQHFVRPPEGRAAIGCATLFIGLPALSAVLTLAERGLLFAAIPVALALVLFALVYYVFSEEVRVELDEHGMRLRRTRVLLGARLAEKLDWEIPLASLTQAREVHTRTPASRGGWNHRAVLQLPEGRTIDATALGGAEDSQSAFNRLSRALAKRLGDRFERRSPTT